MGLGLRGLNDAVSVAHATGMAWKSLYLFTQAQSPTTPRMSSAAEEGGEAYDYEGGGDYAEEDLDAELAAAQALLEEAEAANEKIIETTNSAKAEAAEVIADKAKKEEEKKERDDRSVFVKNVHWDATGEEVAAYFSSCGPVERCTISTDKFGAAKGCGPCSPSVPPRPARATLRSRCAGC